eukprot:3825887-Pleurochrysis_carterae.AAC.2
MYSPWRPSVRGHTTALLTAPSPLSLSARMCFLGACAPFPPPPSPHPMFSTGGPVEAATTRVGRPRLRQARCAPTHLSLSRANGCLLRRPSSSSPELPLVASAQPVGLDAQHTP